jgi:hypothetical protein
LELRVRAVSERSIERWERDTTYFYVLGFTKKKKKKGEEDMG